MKGLKVGDAVIYKERKQYILRFLKNFIAITNLGSVYSYQHVDEDDLVECKRNTYYLFESRRFSYKNERDGEGRGYTDYKINLYVNDLGMGLAKLYCDCSLLGELKATSIKHWDDRYIFRIFNQNFIFFFKI